MRSQARARHRRRLAVGGRRVIYRAIDLKVGLFRDEAAMQPRPADRRDARTARDRDADEADHEAGRRHRDGHRLVDRQQHPGSAGEPARGQVRHFARRQIRRARLPLPGARRAHARRRGGGRPPRHALPRRRRGLEPRRHGAGDPRRRPRGGEISNERTGIIMGSGRPVDARHRRGRRHRAQQGPEARRPVRGAQGDVVDRLGDARHLVQDQGRQLFDLVGLRDLEPLHRQRR